MARTVDDCALFMKAACVPETWQGDVNTPHMPFDSATFENKGETTTNKLVIGYFQTDEWFAPSVASRRAVQETVQHLTKAGHTCKPITLPTNGWFNYGLLVKINAAEGKLRSFQEALEGEPLIPEFNTLRLATHMPDLLRWIARKVVDERKAYLLGCASTYHLAKVLHTYIAHVVGCTFSSCYAVSCF
jgi:Asp-tRNA(Asn)/Glu-tRNA(Gln) amidotransferase A subunit family amidase